MQRFFALLCLFFIIGCNSEPSDAPRFDFDLRGTWSSNDFSVYDGGLVIEYNRITILGYEEAQTPPLGDDERRPFREFTKGTSLSGYSEDGIIHIREAGVWYEIPYAYYSENNGRDKFLRFTFGNRIETLRRE